MSIKENQSKMSWNLSASMFSLKSIILISLCLQNAGYTLLRKYTTQYEKTSSKEILLVSELIKLGFSIFMVYQDHKILPSKSLNDLENGQLVNQNASQDTASRLIWLIQNSYKMFVLAMIYAAMNILSFVALQYIGAGEFTICAQLKILTTAVFSVIILHTSLTYTKWRALGLLVLGCILVASPSFNHASSGQQVDLSLQLLGYAAVLTEVFLSGFASIYFERVVKSTTENVSIWERNVQLGLYSILMYSGIMIYEQSHSDQDSQGFLNGWTSVTFLVSFLGAAGGLLVAATLKYADSILKTLAAAGAIVLSTILGHYFLDGPLDLIVSIGGFVTIIAIANYTLDSTTF